MREVYIHANYKMDGLHIVNERDRIISVEPEIDKYRTCNICRSEVDLCNVSLGCDNRSSSVTMCRCCLEKLRDRIIEFLEEYEFDKIRR